jgi:hypothetical protein
MPLPLIPHQNRKSIPLLKQVLIMETLRNCSPRPLSPYSDEPESRAPSKASFNSKPSSFNLITIDGNENSDPFSDAHEVKSLGSPSRPQRRRLAWRLPSCLRWSFCAFVQEVKALVGIRSRALGLKSLDGRSPFTLRRVYMLIFCTESRQPLWKAGSGAYVPMGKGGGGIGVREAEEMV